MTAKDFTDNGFVMHRTPIANYFEMVLEDKIIPGELPLKNDVHIYRAISATMCNDKGKFEYYLFLREGEEKREEDNVVTLTRNLQTVDELKDFVRLLKL